MDGTSWMEPRGWNLVDGTSWKKSHETNLMA